MQHTYSSPQCVCNDCMGLRMTKTPRWFAFWFKSYENPATREIPFAARVSLVDKIDIAAEYVDSGLARREKVPEGGNGISPSYEEYIDTTLKDMGVPLEQRPPLPSRQPTPAPKAPPAPAPAPAKPEEKRDRFQLIEIE